MCGDASRKIEKINTTQSSWAVRIWKSVQAIISYSLTLQYLHNNGFALFSIASQTYKILLFSKKEKAGESFSLYRIHILKISRVCFSVSI